MRWRVAAAYGRSCAADPRHVAVIVQVSANSTLFSPRRASGSTFHHTPTGTTEPSTPLPDQSDLSWPRAQGQPQSLYRGLMDQGAEARRTAWLLCAASAVLFGATTPAAKLILADVSPVTLAGLLYIGAALVAGPVAARQPFVRPNHGDVAKVAGAVIVALLATLALFETYTHEEEPAPSAPAPIAPPPAPEAQTAPHRAFGYAELTRHIDWPHATVIRLHDHIPLIAWQFLQRLPYARARQPVEHLLPRVFGVSQCIYGGSVLDRSFHGAGTFTQAIDRRVPDNREDPAPLVPAFRVELARPLPDAQEGVLHGLLRQVEVAQPADQGRQHLAGFAPVSALHQGGHV